LTIVSLLRRRSFPVLASREYHAYRSEKTCHYLRHLGFRDLFFGFSLFFSLLAGKIYARTVRVGLRGAPFFFSAS
jgi:hypothetical protein